jgi:hypothetical protein
LDVLLEPIWEDDGNVEFNVTFLNPGSMVPRQHEDYDFRILKDGSEVFSAAKQTGQFLIHTAESTVHIPYTFEQNGGYTVEVTIYGLGFPPVPIDPESAEFPIQVTPEFPTGALSMVLLMVGGIVVCSRFRNPV